MEEEVGCVRGFGVKIGQEGWDFIFEEGRERGIDLSKVPRGKLLTWAGNVLCTILGCTKSHTLE